MEIYPDSEHYSNGALRPWDTSRTPTACVQLDAHRRIAGKKLFTLFLPSPAVCIEQLELQARRMRHALSSRGARIFVSERVRVVAIHHETHVCS